MSEFLQWSIADQREAIHYAADRSGRPPHLLEKDVWVVWTLQTLFESSIRDYLIFKGGTSLSKAYGIIRRFSEDVDLTYDIRAVARDLVDIGDSDPLPRTRSQQQKWTREIRARLPRLLEAEIVPVLFQALKTQGLSATVRCDGEKAYLEYEPRTTSNPYVRALVMLEFGARSSGEPHEMRQVGCDMAPHLPDITMPRATVRVMLPERTFWEKATAIHVFCLQGSFRGGDRFSRHWHDLTRLDHAGYAGRAIAARSVAEAVARHKTSFFAEKDSGGRPIDYHTAVSGGLRLVPDPSGAGKLADDYQRMLDGGLLLDDSEPFGNILEQCRRIEEIANRR